jgi:curved DNA-binding protein CbpA
MVENRELYSTLNLGPDADEAQIRASYLKISRLLHPDKQSAANKQMAEKAFSRLRHSKNTLLDKTKKYIYDKFGLEGIELIERRKHIAQFDVSNNKEIEKLDNKIQSLMYKARHHRYLTEVNHRSNITLNLSCADYLDSTSDFASSRWHKKLTDESFVLSELIKLNLTSRLTGDLGFLLYTSDAGCLSAITPKLSYSFGSGYVLSSAFQIGNHFHASVSLGKSFQGVAVSTQFDVSSSGIVPKLALAKAINEQVNVKFNLSGGENQACAVSITNNRSKNSKIQYKIDSSKKNFSASVHFSHELYDKVYFKLGASVLAEDLENKRKQVVRILPSFGLAVCFNKSSSASYTVEPSSQGIQLVSKFRNGETEIKVPLRLSNFASLQKFVFCSGIVVGLALWTYLLHKVLRPGKLFDKRTKQEILAKDALEDHKAHNATIREPASFIRIRERQRNGLIILYAVYGIFDEKLEATTAHCIDVTDALQLQVEDSRLYLTAKSKSTISGFYKVAEESASRLYIKYSFADVVSEKILQDTEILVLP